MNPWDDCPANLQDGWPVGHPEQCGFDPTILQDMRRRVSEAKLDNVHAIIVARDGVLVYEQYSAGQDQIGLEPAVHTTFDATIRHNGNSMTKSVTSLLFGVALERGWIKGLDTSVLSCFPEYDDLRTSEKRRITLRHLLTMSDGLDRFEFKPPHDSMKRMREAPDAYRYILERPIVAPPGRTYNYNSGSTELLGAVMRKASGAPLDILAQQHLFDPMGIQDVEWNRRFTDGNPMASSSLRARPRDWAKLGQLVLDRGAWNGKQLVQPKWIADSIKARNNGPGQFLYGYHWWLGRSYCGGQVIEWVGAMGWAGQRLIVIPRLNMLMLVNAWLPDRMNFPEAVLLNEYICRRPYNSKRLTFGYGSRRRAESTEVGSRPPGVTAIFAARGILRRDLVLLRNAITLRRRPENHDGTQTFGDELGDVDRAGPYCHGKASLRQSAWRW